MICPWGMLGFYLCGFAFHVRRPGGRSGPWGGYFLANHEITWTLFGKPFGILGWKGFMLQGAGTTAPRLRCPCFPNGVQWTRRATIPTGRRRRSDGKFSAFMILTAAVLHHHVSLFAELGVGGGVACRNSGQTSAWATVMWIRRIVRGSHARRGDLPHLLLAHPGPPPRPNTTRKGKSFTRSRLTIFRFVMLGTFILAFGLVRIPIQDPPSPERTCASLSSPSTRCWPRRPARLRRRSTCGVQRTRNPIVHDVQRHVWPAWCHHRPVRLCQRGRRASSASSRAPCRGIGVLLRTDRHRRLASAPSRSMAQMAPWGCLSIGPPGGRHLWRWLERRVGNRQRIVLRRRPQPFWAELVGVVTCLSPVSVLSIIVFFIAEKVVGTVCPWKMRSKDLTFLKWAVPGYSGS